jgi:hypothetical protein
MGCNIHGLQKLGKRKLQEELIYFICQNILERGRRKEGGKKRGDGKGNSTRLGQLF